jgi:uncharacterized protein (DUF1330 family)
VFVDPSEKNAVALINRSIEGPVVMLNLLRFRSIADYRAYPHLAPDIAISGREAYDIYMDLTRPVIEANGSALGFVGGGGQWFVGPDDERWDLMLLVRHPSVQQFFAYADEPQLQAAAGHRYAALADSRLLPLTQRD